MRAVELTGVSKSFGGAVALAETTLAVAAGEAVGLFGPSGCGKTTLLRIAAGLETPDRGRVLIGGRPAAGDGVFLPPRERGIAMVFQDFALWPHLTVMGHLDFVLRGRALTRGQRRERIAAGLDLVELRERGRERPMRLSGGEQQRLAIARALATASPILLLDEPFANLDARLRERIVAELVRRKRAENVAILIATHSRDDLAILADRVVMMGP
jgi:iron(III) transport system ATP-binding protein